METFELLIIKRILTAASNCTYKENDLIRWVQVDNSNAMYFL